MIASGFKPVGWVAAVGAAALGCYMLSLRVASERADLTSLERRIVQTRQQIRALQTELGTRGRLQQLEQWNDDVLALGAPVSGQFVEGHAALARFATGQAPAPGGAGEVRMASAEPAPPPAPATPAPRHAVASPQRAVTPPPPLQQPLMQRASLTVPAEPAPAPGRIQAIPVRTQAPPPRIRTASATPTRTAAPPPARTRAVSARPPAAAPSRRASLLDERVLRDIGTAARAERRGGNRD